MRRRIRQAESDGPRGAPEWMVTFSDCMTLLLTFFVLLLSFSSFDIEFIRRLKVVFSETLPAVSDKKKETGDAFLPTRQIQSTERPDEGSEKPTLARGTEDNLRKETEPMDFYSRKVFLTPSSKVFWGKGTVISAQGRDIIATIASFMKEVPNRIVISEGTPQFSTTTEDLGMSRAWAVMEYLTTGQGMDRKRFSISAASTIGEESINSTAGVGVKPETERMLEIVLLEGSICN